MSSGKRSAVHRRGWSQGRKPPLLIGLTGSIGMGKSTVAGMLRNCGMPVHDADAAVHQLMGPNGAALARIDAAFPGVVGPDGVDRPALGKVVFGDPKALKRLESILHPMVRDTETAFLNYQARRGAKAVILDIPLLFETGGDRRMDHILVVSAPTAIQTARVMARPGMTLERLAAIRRKQLPDVIKRRRADIVIPTGTSRRITRLYVRAALRRLVPKD